MGTRRGYARPRGTVERLGPPAARPAGGAEATLFAYPIPLSGLAPFPSGRPAFASR